MSAENGKAVQRECTIDGDIALALIERLGLLPDYNAALEAVKGSTLQDIRAVIKMMNWEDIEIPEEENLDEVPLGEAA